MGTGILFMLIGYIAIVAPEIFLTPLRELFQLDDRSVVQLVGAVLCFVAIVRAGPIPRKVSESHRVGGASHESAEISRMWRTGWSTAFSARAVSRRKRSFTVGNLMSSWHPAMNAKNGALVDPGTPFAL